MDSCKSATDVGVAPRQARTRFSCPFLNRWHLLVAGFSVSSLLVSRYFRLPLFKLLIIFAIRVSLAISLIFSMAAFAQQSTSAGQSLLLENARVIVGDGTVLERASVLVVDGMIESVATDSDIPAAGHRVINLSGKTLMPAMIDAHAHLGYQGEASWGAENYNRENLIANLQRYAYYGFAAVFSAGSDPAEFMQQIQVSEADGEFVGARPLFAAGMAPPGQGPNNQFLAQALAVEEALGQQILYGLENSRQAREAVRAVAAKDVHYVKIWVDDRGGSQQKLAPAIAQAVADESARNGLKLFVHQQSPADMLPLLEAGADGFLHGRFGSEFDASIARATARAGAFVIPNLGLGELRREAIGEDPFLLATHSRAIAEPMTAGNGQRQRERNSRTTSDQAVGSSLMAAIAEGVDIVLGTDAGAVPEHPFGYSGHRELEIYVRLGMTPMQALVAATSKAAQHLGLDDMGMIAQGFSADLLVLEDDPSQDIRATRSIDSVYLRGRLVPREQLAEAWLADN